MALSSLSRAEHILAAWGRLGDFLTAIVGDGGISTVTELLLHLTFSLAAYFSKSKEQWQNNSLAVQFIMEPKPECRPISSIHPALFSRSPGAVVALTLIQNVLLYCPRAGGAVIAAQPLQHLE